MRRVLHLYSFLLSSLFLLHHLQAQRNIDGYTCSTNRPNPRPCQAYVYYQAMAPDLLDLADIGDLFGVSRLMIAEASNISSPNSTLSSNQNLFIPIACSCHSNFSRSYANITYIFKPGDTFYLLSTGRQFQNLTTYQATELVNPTLIPTNISIGAQAVFPIFCKCPNRTQRHNNITYLITYVIQPNDTFASIAQKFGLETQSLIDINGNTTIDPYLTIFLPVSRLPELTQPSVNVASVPTPASPASPTPSSRSISRKHVIVGLGIGLGVSGFLLLLLLLLLGEWVRRDSLKRSNEMLEKDKEKKMGFGRAEMLEGDDSFVANIKDCLDKYRVFGIEEIGEATARFDPGQVIQGSVYKGCIGREVYAIKKMKWDALEELKILQKVRFVASLLLQCSFSLTENG